VADIDTWQLPVHIDSADDKAKSVHLYLARGVSMRLVAPGRATREELLGLAVEAPGVLIATTRPVETLDQLVDEPHRYCGHVRR
jgi:hypothetical protein